VKGSSRSSDRAATVLVPNPHAVLIVDDDLGTRETFAVALERLGLAVQAADSGAEGLKIAKSRPFDLLLVDLELPDMRGIELVQFDIAAAG
jgi:CheY-like chemotaxis protein